MRTPMRHSHSGHYSYSIGKETDGLKYRVPFSASTDGNTGRNDTSVEQAQFGKAAADYQTTWMFIENKISGIRKSLRGE